MLTNDDRLYARAAMYHDVGSYERTGWVETDEPLFVGVNYRMPELSAAILRPQLRRLDSAAAPAARAARRCSSTSSVASAVRAVTCQPAPRSRRRPSAWRSAFDDPDEARAVRRAARALGG